MAGLKLKLLTTVISLCLLGLPIALYGVRACQRPAQTNVERSLFQGISYRQEVRSRPRPLMIHQVRIDLTAPGVRAFVTPGTPAPGGRQLNARTPSEFLREFKLQLAINANFFYPFREKTPWDFYPHSGDRVNVVGQAISNQIPYSRVVPSWPALCLSAPHKAQIEADGKCPINTMQAVTGSALIVFQGKARSVPKGAADNDGLYSRTAVGIDAKGETVWIVAIDDKQPFYSEGVTLAELADILVKLGADTALNLDGGGSTTLVMATPTGSTTLNAPIHTKIPLRERPVANHLGFYALPLKGQ